MLQGKFGKEKSVMAFQNTFGSLPERANLELTEMMFNSSSSRRRGGSRRHGKRMQLSHDDVKLTKEIFLPEPKIVQPYTRYMMHRSDESSMDGFQKSGCHTHYYNRMMKVSSSSHLTPHNDVRPATHSLNTPHRSSATATIPTTRSCSSRTFTSASSSSTPATCSTMASAATMRCSLRGIF